MKRIITFLSVALALAVSCKQETGTPLKADFEVDETNVLVGDIVTFNDCSLGQATMWNWSFEGATPATSILTSPQIQWFEAGTYSVTLNIANSTESSEITKTQLITVSYYDHVTADFSMDRTRAYSDEVVTFTNLSTGFPNNVKWTFTPKTGTPVTSTELNPALTFEPGIYSVKLEISSPVSSDSKEVADALEVLDPNAVTAGFKTFSSTIYQGGNVAFLSEIQGPVKEYQWTFEGGTPATSTDANPVIKYNSLGKYKVSLKVINGSYNDTKEVEGYIHVVPAEGLMFLLPFDGDTKDYGPNGFHPSVYSKGGFELSFLAKDGGEQCVKFPGGEKAKTYAILQMPDALYNTFTPGSDATYSFWTKTPAVGANQAIIAQGDCPGTPNATNQIWCRFQTGNNFRVLAETTGKSSTGPTVSNAKFQDNTWHNITFVYYNQGKDFVFYLDGESISNQHYTDTGHEKQTSTNPFFIGANMRLTSGAWAPENMYAGQMDDFILYKKALTAAEVKSLIF